MKMAPELLGTAAMKLDHVSSTMKMHAYASMYYSTFCDAPLSLRSSNRQFCLLFWHFILLFYTVIVAYILVPLSLT